MLAQKPADATAPAPTQADPALDSLSAYARALHDYTLHLWIESLRQAEERTRRKAELKMQHKDATVIPT
ncbi:hypothetical protein FA95DRAFT_1601110 [Auriscalpium vulgare]|uniref:Uncharacterized protein n=1 Tax=Auriscalpium vulgare TaxID=40419 RepID=A0ACB8SBE5_9AGAM|nr:hypothetical protein FA95DRAFT_1601110 [Auriscalpium vulgare]